MTNFKINDEVKEKLNRKQISGVVESINTITNFLRFSHSPVWYDPKLFELVQPKPIYPNLPHKHVDMICHVANGGIVKDKNDSSIIDHVSQSEWYSDDEYEIVLHKTKNELRIDKLEKMVHYHKDAVDVISKELKILKNN